MEKKKDEHFEIYYTLIAHKCDEDHFPYRELHKGGEGGGCPVIIKRP